MKKKSTKRIEKFREICSLFAGKKCSLNVVLDFINKEKWISHNKKKQGDEN